MKITFLALLFTIIFCVSVFSQEAEKVDEFGRISCDDYLARMDNAINEATNHPNSTVYILIYEGKETRYNSRKKKDELVLPTIGSARAKIDSIKEYLSRRKISAENFSFVEAGFREEPAVEIWLVPKESLPPKPTPTIDKMKYRGGKARGFCTWCC